jgi:hypothetical protein
MSTGFESTINHKPGHRELAHRSGSGLEVTLLWEPATDALVVCVCDHERGAYFELSPERHRALNVYYHPYAYLDFCSFGYEDARLAA